MQPHSSTFLILAATAVKRVKKEIVKDSTALVSLTPQPSSGCLQKLKPWHAMQVEVTRRHQWQVSEIMFKLYDDLHGSYTKLLSEMISLNTIRYFTIQNLGTCFEP